MVFSAAGSAVCAGPGDAACEPPISQCHGAFGFTGFSYLHGLQKGHIQIGRVDRQAVPVADAVGSVVRVLRLPPPVGERLVKVARHVPEDGAVEEINVVKHRDLDIVLDRRKRDGRLPGAAECVLDAVKLDGSLDGSFLIAVELFDCSCGRHAGGVVRIRVGEWREGQSDVAVSRENGRRWGSPSHQNYT